MAKGNCVGLRQRERLRHSTAKESSATAKELWANGKGKGKFRSTARKACCCFRSVRSSGHAACDGKAGHVCAFNVAVHGCDDERHDGKAYCRSLFIPTGGAGATAASQSQHELMTSLALRPCVSQWQRCIVRTIE